ncbi:MAG TPA: energy transducer TonB [Hyphomonadaceae bacterium]|nr:energy transducer TonB [Hyphomonadaceae bacterium]
MYGAMRNRASNSSQLAGLSIAALITALAGVALANGFGQTIIRMIEIPITFTPLPDEVLPDNPVERTLDMDVVSLDMPLPPLPPIPNWVPEDVPPVVTLPPVERTGPATGTGASVVPSLAPVRSRPVLLKQSPPDYPASAIRANEQGNSAISVCVDARGRVSSASLANSSGSTTLDNAALKWVRNARFTPGKLDGVAQSVCGHTVVYEWNLADAR